MNALEFSTKIEKGLIKIPHEYKELDNSFVRIIILSDSDALIETSSKKERLKMAFKNLQKVKSLSDIENPSDWQKALRDEWK